jgi:hypothetical protein
MGALHQPGPIMVFDFPSPRLRKHYRKARVVIVGTPHHVNLLAASGTDCGSVWDPPSDVPVRRQRGVSFFFIAAFNI